MQFGDYLEDSFMKKLLLSLTLLSLLGITELTAMPSGRIWDECRFMGYSLGGLQRIPRQLFNSLCSMQAWNTCAAKCQVMEIISEKLDIVDLDDVQATCMSACLFPLSSIQQSSLLKCPDFYADETVITGTPNGYGNASCSYTYNGKTYANLTELNEGLGYCADGYANEAPFKASCHYSFPEGTASYID